GGDRDDLRVVIGPLYQFLGEDLGVAGGAGLRRLGLETGDYVDLDRRVVLVSGVLGRRVALALLGDDVDQHRLVDDVAGVLQDVDQGVHVVTVDRPDVIEAQLLEEGPPGDHAA